MVLVFNYICELCHMMIGVCIMFMLEVLVLIIDLPLFHGIFNVFSLSLVCVQKPFCIDFYVSFSLFAGNLSKDEHISF